MEKLEAFKTELKALLDKYNATIACDVEGDTHGVSMTIVVELDKKDYKLAYGCSVDQSDIKLK